MHTYQQFKKTLVPPTKETASVTAHVCVHAKGHLLRHPPHPLILLECKAHDLHSGRKMLDPQQSELTEKYPHPAHTKEDTK